MPITLKLKGANSKIDKITHLWQFCLYLEDGLNVNIFVLYLFSLVKSSVPFLQLLLAKILCPKRDLKYVLFNFILLCCPIWYIYSMYQSASSILICLNYPFPVNFSGTGRKETMWFGNNYIKGSSELKDLTFDDFI